MKPLIQRCLPEMRVQVRKHRGVVVLALATVAAIFFLILLTLSRRGNAYPPTEDRVRRAIRASFPNFCRDSQILVKATSFEAVNPPLYPTTPTATPEPGRYWAIGCDRVVPDSLSYLKNGVGVIIDAQTCTVLEPGIASLTLITMYYGMFQYGNTMSVCPAAEP